MTQDKADNGHNKYENSSDNKQEGPKVVGLSLDPEVVSLIEGHADTLQDSGKVKQHSDNLVD